MKTDPIIIAAADRIHLNDIERNIFQLLKDCVTSRGLQVNMRVAGGWVRDKLLRLDCKDIDIALDTMMGETFASHLVEYMRSKDIQPTGVGVIHSNPERSKHLETATIHIFGQPIDFVNLRSEEYADGSRIPEKIAFGTPLEDALRRDITINTLFYHVQNKTIEDWTGFGLVDLEEGVVRTPLAPEATLLDDPLRLLRIIRFASRYGYAPVPEIIETGQKSIIHTAFQAKVSRERVGIEFDKTISDANAFQGLRLYSRLNAFTLLTMDEPADYHRLLDIFEAVVIPNVVQETLRLACLCAPLVPLNNSVDRVGLIVRNALKLPNKDVSDTRRMFKEHLNISQLINSNNPVKLGRLVRECGPNWRLAFLLSCAQDVYERELVGVQLKERLSEHLRLIERIDSLSLCDAFDMLPLLTGRDIQLMLNNLQQNTFLILVKYKILFLNIRKILYLFL